MAKEGTDGRKLPGEDAHASMSTPLLARTRKYMRGVASCVAYVGTSVAMVLMNKYVLSGFGWRSTNSLLLFQTFCCVVIVKGLALFGLIKLEPLSWKLIKAWAPVNVIFVGMIWSSFFSIKYIGVAMMTVLKNTTNIIVVFGDIYFFNRKQPLMVWVALGLILASALCGAFTDLSFDAQGYSWQMVNCGFTAAYSLYLRGVMNNVSSLTRSGKGLDQFTMAYINNLLSMPMIVIIIFFFGEFPEVLTELNESSAGFRVAAVLSGILSLGISFSSLWFLSETSPTTYSIVGSLNKIPTAILGLLFFNVPTTLPNILSIGVGLLAGVVFTQAKLSDNKQ
eukprot:CAMPEP_0118935570 /NCGR_PEP_ID=MMETSP1169-20130426/15714_1 /TAXON_ID=36882 /ORGANISM="Pyramimonas obovata, Strain CCMP722" /LENGTH=336 /DNA_ID=CAMNT_0006878621 /DNA_START=297 /DNA_END=1307 /DNA_ORIENTATION=-